MDANLHLENMIQIGLTDKEIELAMCDKEEIRYPASIMPHGTCIVLHKHTRKPIAVAANFDDILNVKNEKDENFLWVLPESFWYDLERHKKGYLGRYLLKNIAMVQWQADIRNTQISFTVGDIPQMVYGDETRFSQMLLNYLNNALKHGAKEHIEIHTETIKNHNNGMGIKVSVIDDGD